MRDVDVVLQKQTAQLSAPRFQVANSAAHLEIDDLPLLRLHVVVRAVRGVVVVAVAVAIVMMVMMVRCERTSNNLDKRAVNAPLCTT